jgi:hypothetical protein
MAEHNAKEEMEIAENFPLHQNAYKIYKNAMNNHWKENKERNTICQKLSQKETSCHRKKLSGTRKKFQSREEIFVTERNFLTQKETCYHSKKPFFHGKTLPVTQRSIYRWRLRKRWRLLKMFFASKCLHNMSLINIFSSSSVNVALFLICVLQ